MSGESFALTNFVPGPTVYMVPCKFCCSDVYIGPFAATGAKT